MNAAATFLIFWLLLALVFAGVAPDDGLSFLIVLALPLAPALAHGCERAFKISFNRRIQLDALVALCTILLVSTNFRIREYSDKSIDAQASVRLFGVALLLVLGAPVLLRRLQAGIPLEPLLWLCFLTYLLISTTYAASPAHALFGAVSFYAGFLFVWNLAEVYGREALIRVLLGAFAVLCVASLIVYFAVPDLGRLKDWENGTLVSTWRLQGVLGAPNGVGGSAGFALLSAVLLLKPTAKRLGFWAMIGLFAVCLLLSNNRMAIAGLAACASFLFLFAGNARIRGVLILLVGTLVAVASFFLMDEILVGLSRSGSPEELLTVTGRTDIWQASLALWLEHPLFGLGFNSSLQILPMRADLFTAAAHTHNVFLEVLFSGGLLGLGLFAAALAATIRRSALCGRYSNIGIVLFFLVHGMTEPIVFGSISYYTIAFFAAMVLAFIDDRETQM
jgi:O-antigen ligase